MTTVPHAPELLTSLAEQTPRVNAPVAGLHHIELAHVANHALLDTPAGRFNLDLIDTDGVYSFSYVRNPGAKYLRLEARINAQRGLLTTGFVLVDLTIRDAGGHSVVSSSSHVPRGFKGETLRTPSALVDVSLVDQLAVVGTLDCDALAATLTDPSWSFDFTLTFGGGAEVNTLQCWEIPRFLVDDSVDHGGMLPGAFQRDQPLTDSDTIGLERLLETLVSARQVERTYVSLAWRQQVVVTGETPHVSATSFQYLTALSADAAPQTWRLAPRQIATGSTAGESLRYRVLYRMSGGAGSETGQVRLVGNATGSPWATASLAYTTTWTWSPWINAAIRTSPLADTLSLEGKVSGSGPTLWVAGVHVREHVT